MRKERYKGLTLEIHDSIDEMDIIRFQNYNRCLLIDAEIGSDADAISRHYSKLLVMAKHGRYDDLIVQITNYHQCLVRVVSNTNVEMATFACLVDKVNGKKFTDFSEEGIKGLIKKIGRGGVHMG